MSTNSAKMANFWANCLQEIDNLLLNTPELLSSKMWNILPNYQQPCAFCSKLSYASFLNSTCCQIASLCNVYDIGQPHERPIYNGFRSNSDPFTNKFLVVRQLSVGPTSINVVKNNYGYRLFADPASFTILTTYLLQDLVELIPKMIIAFRCNQYNYILQYDDNNKLQKRENITLDAPSRQLIDNQIDYLYDTLAKYQWYEVNILNCLWLRPHTDQLYQWRNLSGRYSLIYLPSREVELKIKLKNENKDLWLSSTPFSLQSAENNLDSQKLMVKSHFLN